ncbi:MAG: metallophosphoesterase [Clostridiales bacterium]|nr:metallophosphoesterase [Clostridiales bacterium]
MVYFAADTHFGHANVIRFCGRPFETVDEMDRILVANWNSRVRNNDTVYVLGDMFYRCDISRAEDILRQLKGQKKLIVGNHDHSWMSGLDVSRYFDEVSLMLEGTDGQHVFTVCHYPLLSWRRQARAYMIHGHIHNDTKADFFPLLVERENALNAGVDINEFVPVTFEELLSNNRIFKERWRRENEPARMP